MLFAELIANDFNKEELLDFMRSLGVDASGFSGSTRQIAHELVGYMYRRGFGLQLLQKVQEQRSHLDLTPHLYLAIYPALTSDEIRDWHKELGLPPPLDRFNTSAYGQLILDHYREKDQLTAFLTRVKPHLPAIDALLETAPPVMPQIIPPEPAPERRDAVDYENFDVLINPRQADGLYSLLFRAPEGEVRTEMALPGEQDDFADRIYYLRELMGALEDAQVLGTRLREFLFPPAAWTLFTSSLATVRARQKAGLRVRLHIDLDSPELNQIPWEYCLDDKSFMAVNKQTPIIRYIPTNRPPRSINVPEQVRILLVTASPTDQPALDVDREVANVKEALARMVENGRIQLAEVPNATRRDLRKKVQSFDPHILHFIGHGALQENGAGVLALQDRRGNTERVDADDMLVLLQDRSTRLVILSACETGARSEAEADARGLMGVAPKLVWGGMPAVLAMQFAAADDATIEFMDTLYDELAAGEPLDTAVTEARIGLYFDFDDKTFWANPVLFLRAPDGNIW